MTVDASDWLPEPYRNRVSTQQYGPRPAIDGVRLIDLPLFSDEGGDFCEVTRFETGGTLSHFQAYMPAQISYSLLEPGAIKAWHLHSKQDDLWFVPPAHRLLVGLLDLRPDAGSYEISMRLVLGAGRARLLFIPHGVAHGVANLGTHAASLLYLSNFSFDPHEPDEHRLPYDLLGADFWTIRPG